MIGTASPASTPWKRSAEAMLTIVRGQPGGERAQRQHRQPTLAGAEARRPRREAAIEDEQAGERTR
jgi:hypothetical protein